MDSTRIYYMSENKLSRLISMLPKVKLISYNRNRCTHYYVKFPMTFDIESTTIANPEIEDIEKYSGKDKYIGFMYHWQCALPNDNINSKNFLIVCGRRWEEFQEFLHVLEEYYYLNEYKRLVIYAHGLFYEFQFIRNFVEVSNVFARKKREPLKFIANDCFEFRCSYMLTNMSLAKAIKNTPKSIYNKLSGDDYDYRKIRTPNTKMSDLELEYCYNDVRGLLEVILHYLEEDDLKTIPLTSTGFIRRTSRTAVQKNPQNRKDMLWLRLNPEQYSMCRNAFRGGNSAVNPYLSNQILTEIGSYDRKSSYPAEMLVDFFPVTPFQSITPNQSTVDSYKDKAMLMMVTLLDLNMKSRMTIAYIAKGKCLLLTGKQKGKNPTLVIANGRVIKAESATMIITDIDYKIISEHYNFIPHFTRVFMADYGHLNDEYRRCVLDIFIEKTKLERGDQYLYAKFKNKVNAFFGMMVTDICSPEIYLENGEWKDEKEKNGFLDIAKKLDYYYNNRSSFLNYQQGVWVTANARYRHQQGIDACGDDIVMGDTDSCKFIGNHAPDFEKLNKEWTELCYNNDIVPIVKVWEEPTIMGIWNKEKGCDEYKTLGAKRHAYKYEGVDHYDITVAGCNKDKGGEWLSKLGSLDYFTDGVTIPSEYSGRTISYYNDKEEPYQMEVDGCIFTNGSNIGVIEGDYTFCISDDFMTYLIGIGSESIDYIQSRDSKRRHDEAENRLLTVLRKERELCEQ